MKSCIFEFQIDWLDFPICEKNRVSNRSCFYAFTPRTLANIKVSRVFLYPPCVPIFTIPALAHLPIQFYIYTRGVLPPVW
jgi:hypothetical protein